MAARVRPCGSRPRWKPAWLTTRGRSGLLDARFGEVSLLPTRPCPASRPTGEIMAAPLRTLPPKWIGHTQAKGDIGLRETPTSEDTMTIRASTSILLLITLVTRSLPVAAEPHTSPLTARELFEGRRMAHAIVSVELRDSTVAIGSIGRTTKRTFSLLDGTRSMGRAIAYADVCMLTDQTTGERFEVQAPIPTGQTAGSTPSRKAWLWIGVAVAVFLLVVYLHTPKD
jgi:hypothetical protein